MKRYILFLIFLCLPMLMLAGKKKPQLKPAATETERPESPEQQCPDPLARTSRPSTPSPIHQISDDLMFHELADGQSQQYFDEPEAPETKATKALSPIPEDWLTVQPSDLTPPSATALTDNHSWLTACQEWFQANVAKTYLVEQCTTTLKIVTTYSVLTAVIRQNKLREFTTYFDTKSSGGGLRWLDKAINQAVDAQDETAIRTILDAAKEINLLDIMADRTKKRAEAFLLSQLIVKGEQAIEQLELFGQDIRELTATIMATRHLGRAELPPLLADSQIRNQARETVQDFTQFSSSQKLILPTPREK